MLSHIFKRHILNVSRRRLCTNVQYEQGQSPEPKIREYFYYIDHQGQLFMDDAKMKNFTSCFKEQKFLEFFFDKIQINESGRYEAAFPYISPCGRERNYIRCDDRPIVFLDLLDSPVSYKPDKLTYGYNKSVKLRTSFQPGKVYMEPESGRLYHPADPEYGGVGLIKSSVAIAISKNFHFEEKNSKSPTHFTWKGVKYQLTYEVAPLMDVPLLEARDMAVELIAKQLQLIAPPPSNN